MPHVFISYAKKDTRALAEALLEALERIPDVTAWMDRGLEPDQSWAGQIMDQIDACDYFVVLLSPDVNRPVTRTQRRSFVLNEIDYAQQFEDEILILPVMVVRTKVPVQIAGIQHIDLTSTPTNPALIVDRVCKRFGLAPTSLPLGQPVKHTPTPDEKAAIDSLCEGGWSKLSRQDLRGAIADFDAALRLDPNFALAIERRGEAKRLLGEYSGAINDFDVALRLNPKSAFALRARGETKCVYSDFWGAISDFDAALVLEPLSARALACRGDAKRLQANYVEAIADLDRALRLMPSDDFALAARGDAKNSIGDFESAIADLDRALMIQPRNVRALCSRGQAKLGLEDYVGALADLDAALTLDPSFELARAIRFVTRIQRDRVR